ncbi:methyltransferase domain-containing protein, partial [SCandidatus Aminicenantes bacterium Aminicenantia_JdfR_composite]|nr:methyltransferase domain-containing protein [SCandidatus Aminicenantes bacterium Aminicenantia_JdfR_composite]
CKSHFEITVQKREGEEVMEGELLCNSCDKTFPIRRGIPRILMGQDYHLKKETQKNFAFSWKKFSSIYEDERDFLDWIYPKNKEFFKNKIVLDAGCGTGKHASFASQFGAKEVIAFDLSDSVEVAFDINRQLDNVHIIQTDIYYLPFKEDFDYVYCIGVLQHLPDPEKGFYNLSKLLRKKGWISIWVYGYEGTTFVRKFIDPIRKHLTSKMPPSLVLALSFFPATIFYLLAKGLYKPLSKFKPTTKILKFMPMSSYIVYISL